MVIVVQAAVIILMFGLAAAEVLPRLLALLYFMYALTLAAFAANSLILWRSKFLSSKPVLRVAAVVSGALIASALGAYLALLYSVNRWGT